MSKLSNNLLRSPGFPNVPRSLLSCSVAASGVEGSSCFGLSREQVGVCGRRLPRSPLLFSQYRKDGKLGCLAALVPGLSLVYAGFC